ncbi:MAG: CinA family protein [Spirochaetia bacterium]
MHEEWTYFLLGAGSKIESIQSRAAGTSKVRQVCSHEDAPELLEKLGPFCVRKGNITSQGLVYNALSIRGLTMVTAESCTGGEGGGRITELPGASTVYWGGFIVYSNAAKVSLGVEEETLRNHGAVSKATVLELTERALETASADVCFSISGIAGPSGGTAEKPVGTVWISVGTRLGRDKAWRFLFRGNRELIREKSIVAAMLLTEREIQRYSFT